MKKIVFIVIGIFLYADISNVLLKIDKLENFKRTFMKIDLPICKKTTPKQSIIIKNQVKHENALTLNAIFNKKALINNKWVKSGDVLNGYKVMKVFSKQVVLKRGKNIIVLKFNKSLIKVKK